MGYAACSKGSSSVNLDTAGVNWYYNGCIYIGDVMVSTLIVAHVVHSGGLGSVINGQFINCKQ